MNIKIYNDDGTIKEYKIIKEKYTKNSLTNHLGYINSKSKETSLLNIIEAYYSSAKVILFDETNQDILKKIKTLNIPEYKSEKDKKTIFDNKDFSIMLFTSGSTGEAIAALKTKENLEKEIHILTKLLAKHKIKRVIITVPFIHIYGILFAFLYPLLNNLDIILKEHFLPNDLLNLIDDNSLIVTTPLYIKALNKISTKKNLKSSLFVSSTAPLDFDNIQKFIKKFNTNLLQVFGSTETGGVAYRYNEEELWTPMPSVEISINEKNELKVKSPFVSKTLYENSFKQINHIMQTFDYIEKHKNKFKLIGRSSKILKIAGKRYSTVQIESILEEEKEINKALVFVVSSKDSLRGESLDITLESSKKFSVKEIKFLLQSKLSNLKFSIKLKYVDKIAISSVGKKLLIK